MKKLALLVVVAALSVGCAGMGTKRGPGAQIQRTAQPTETVDTGSVGGSLEGRPELGQR